VLKNQSVKNIRMLKSLRLPIIIDNLKWLRLKITSRFDKPVGAALAAIGIFTFCRTAHP
jgi:hypothetical protein